MAYSELIKNFDNIRSYMRDFFIYGFKTREDERDVLIQLLSFGRYIVVESPERLVEELKDRIRRQREMEW